MMRRQGAVVFLGAALSILGCTPKSPAAAPSGGSQASSFTRLADTLLDQWLEDSPAWGRQVGLHKYDGRVAHLAATELERHARWLDEGVAALEAFDSIALTPDSRLDRAMLLNRMKLERFNLRIRELPRTDARFYEELFDVSSYVNFDYAPLDERVRSLVQHEESALEQTPHILKNLQPVLSRPGLQTAIKNYRGFAEYYRGDVAKLARMVNDRALLARFENANEALAKAAETLAEKLESEWLPRASETAHVLGPAKYLAFVEAQEGRPIELEAFTRMAEDSLRENRAAYEKLLPTVKVTRPKADELVAEATRIMNESRQFLLDKRLVSFPSDERALVQVSPPYMRWNAAFLNMPGPYDSVHQGYYYVTLPDPTWSAAEQEEYVFARGTLLATTVHEVYPGHFLHGLWTRRAPTRSQRMGDSYSFTEGWAHYVEQMMVDEGFGSDDPQNRLGQLGDALLRNCRFVVSIGIHARGMSMAEAERRFIEDCHQDRAGAREQATRGTFDPGYFAYTLGKLQLLELRKEAQQRLGKRFDLRAFHDAVLSHGAPPVALIRDRVLGDLEQKAAASAATDR